MVKVYAAGINPVDTYIREGVYSNVPKFPIVLGKEAAGVVEKIGDEVSSFKVIYMYQALDNHFKNVYYKI